MALSDLLFVCEGNICRSPMAEMAWNYLYAGSDGQGYRSASAGLRAMVGEDIDPRSAAALEQAGIPRTEFTARQFTPALVRETVVLTMTRKQCTTVAQLAPAVYPRTFALTELAQLARQFPGSTLQELHRQRRSFLPIQYLDIADPVRLAAERFPPILAQIIDALDSIATLPEFSGGDQGGETAMTSQSDRVGGLEPRSIPDTHPSNCPEV